MKKIIQLSDLHFGTEREGIIAPLFQDIAEQRPDIIVISGDFTQRARHREYAAARDFISKLNIKTIINVPGNHDIALYNLIERFGYPLRKYKKYITSELFPSYEDNHIAILGVNSATPYKAMSGFISDNQLAYIVQYFKRLPESVIKILVMHHNLIASERHKNINHAEVIIEAFASCNINLVLSGHIHCAYIEQLKRSHINHNMYVITAGTSISTRTTELNSYNVVELGNNEFKLTVREFDEGHFKTRSIEDFIL